MKSLIPDCIAHVMSHPDHNVQLANQEEFYSYFDELLARVQQ
jgi:2-succinyl-6-hydroxy-2,4-cyclohexadiene-1-carboxylate synthase